MAQKPKMWDNLKKLKSWQNSAIQNVPKLKNLIEKKWKKLNVTKLKNIERKDLKKKWRKKKKKNVTKLKKKTYFVEKLLYLNCKKKSNWEKSKT